LPKPQDRWSGPLSRAFSCLAALLALTTAPLAAAERWSSLASVVFTHVAVDRSLPNAAFILSLAMDRTGFLWAGTENGLARWDGYRFRVYKATPGVPGSLPDNVILAVYADAHGTLWIGTDSAGLARYDPRHDTFVRFSLGAGALGDTAAVSSFTDDGSGGFWAATGGGLVHVDAAGRIRARVRSGDRDAPRIPPGSLRAVLRDRFGTLWIGARSGLFRRPAGGARFVAVTFPGRAAVEVDHLLEDDGGRIWVGSRARGAFVVEPRSAAPRSVRETDATGSGLGAQSVFTLEQVRSGEIWLGTDDGIVAVDTATMQTRRIRHDPNVAASLPADTVLAVLRDRAGLVWAATTRSLSHCDPSGGSAVSVYGPSTARGGLTGSNVRALLAAPDGRIWAALGKRGVDLLDPAGRRDAHVTLPATIVEGSPVRPGVVLLAPGPAGGVYLGGYRGLFLANGDGTTVRRIALPASVETSGVRAMATHAGRLWFASENGLWTLDARGAIAHVLGDGLRPRLTDDRVTVMAPGPGSSLWIGTESGLNLFDAATRRIERISAAPAQAGGLSTGLISALLTDARGRLWVGTQGSGINVMERDRSGRPRFTRIGTTDGLPNDDINALLEDEHANVWVSTDDGLAVIDPRTLAIAPLHAAEGVGVDGYWMNSSLRTSAGELLFGGLGGLTVVRPQRYHRATFAPPVVVTDTRIGGKPVLAVRTAGDGEAAALLDVPPGERSFAVTFAALDYSAPERLRYAYRLDGFDTGWNEASADARFAVYTNVPPGDYRLRIRGSNRDGVWSDRDAELTVRVEPAWFALPAVRAAELLAGVGAIALFVRTRTGYLRRRQAQLEREVVARTAALSAARTELERLAYIDTLTALPNRRRFTESFATLIGLAQNAGRAASVVLIDLDGFKTINDTMGHDAGDAVLVEAGVRLRGAVRGSDNVFRLGGDEFAILLFEVDERGEMERVCARILASFTAAIPVGQMAAATSPSIGVAFFPDDGQTPDELYKSADLALYDAKRAGRNTWRQYRAALRPVSALGALER
jgi:diguanylate cyclase (GGDEF)-like protein